MTEPEIRLDHPSYRGYKSVEGPLIEAGWEAKAACLGIAAAADIFFSKKSARTVDQEMCGNCPVSAWCLLDSLARNGDYAKQGRRAAMTGEQRRLLDRGIRDLFVGSGLKTPTGPRAYDGKTKLQFYTEDLRAPELVKEHLRYKQERKAHVGERIPDVWPTEQAIEIRDRSAG